MKWILIILGSMVILVILAVITGVLLPRQHRATSVITIRKPPTVVWRVIRDLGQVPAIWPEVEKSERLPDPAQREVWAQSMKNGFTMRLVVNEDHPPTHMTSTIEGPPGAPFGGRWSYDLRPVGEGVAVSITEEGWVSNPVFRLVARIMGYHSTLDSYLTSLGRHFGETSKPEHVSVGS